MEAASRQGLKLLVGETYRLLSSHLKARELIDAGEIDKPLQIHMRHGAWLERDDPKIYTGSSNREWSMDAELSGGGRFPWIFDHAVHLFATAEFFMQDCRISEVHSTLVLNDFSCQGSG